METRRSAPRTTSVMPMASSSTTHAKLITGQVVIAARLMKSPMSSRQ